MSFTAEETPYLRSQPLARLATVSADGQPDVVPVSFEFDGECFWVGGPGASVLTTRKFRNVMAGKDEVALVIDDLVSFEPFIARGIRVYGRAEQPVGREGMVGPGTYMRITPDRLLELEHRGRTGRRHLVLVAPRRPPLNVRFRSRPSAQTYLAWARRRSGLPFRPAGLGRARVGQPRMGCVSRIDDGRLSFWSGRWGWCRSAAATTTAPPRPALTSRAPRRLARRQRRRRPRYLRPNHRRRPPQRRRCRCPRHRRPRLPPRLSRTRPASRSTGSRSRRMFWTADGRCSQLPTPPWSRRSPYRAASRTKTSRRRSTIWSRKDCTSSSTRPPSLDRLTSWRLTTLRRRCGCGSMSDSIPPQAAG